MPWRAYARQGVHRGGDANHENLGHTSPWGGEQDTRACLMGSKRVWDSVSHWALLGNILTQHSAGPFLTPGVPQGPKGTVKLPGGARYENSGPAVPNPHQVSSSNKSFAVCQVNIPQGIRQKGSVTLGQGLARGGGG